VLSQKEEKPLREQGVRGKSASSSFSRFTGAKKLNTKISIGILLTGKRKQKAEGKQSCVLERNSRPNQ